MTIKEAIIHMLEVDAAHTVFHHMPEAAEILCGIDCERNAPGKCFNCMDKLLNSEIQLENVLEWFDYIDPEDLIHVEVRTKDLKIAETVLKDKPTIQADGSVTIHFKPHSQLTFKPLFFVDMCDSYKLFTETGVVTFSI